MSSETQLRCEACSAPLQAGDRFCEQCGARLSEEQPDGIGCHACGAQAAAIDDDGYCSICGVRVRDAANRVELDLTIAAAVSDQGRVHRRNEDAFQLEVVPERGVVVVVCDGISTASASDVAASTAARAAAEVLLEAIAQSSRDGGQAMLDAVGAAHDAVAQVPWTTRADRALPSCTLVSALWRDGEIIVGWVGDSRAYWIAANGSQQLTIDDSWAEEQIAAGLLTLEQAAGDSRFHSITHWVGADAPDRPPRVVTLRPGDSGRLIVCTDGLWNYTPTPAELSALIEALPAGAAPAAIARSLTDTALARGGHDNITVAVVDIDPS
jgi:serine/threonine protein phosphatase PrpC